MHLSFIAVEREDVDGFGRNRIWFLLSLWGRHVVGGGVLGERCLESKKLDLH